jgi:Alkylmercury lyase
VTQQELTARREIMVAFAETGAPPPASVFDPHVLRSLAEQHVVVLDDAGEIRMAHPFAAHDEGATVTAGGRTWRGNCAWDAYGIAAALDLADPVIASQGVTAGPGVVFHVEVPADRWWADVAYT